MTGRQDRWLYRIKRWMYPGNRPNMVARLLNWISVVHFSSGKLAATNWVTLEVRGRRTGKLISCPVVAVDYEGDRYLVSMLGRDANWVRNVRAAGSRAVLRHGRRIPVLLTEVEVGSRAPILRRYLDLAPGARPHIPVPRSAPLAEFERIADRYPVFRVTPVP
jgi:deazaflavin-dependent oxidoreductase (nitroreductase family)